MIEVISWLHIQTEVNNMIYQVGDTVTLKDKRAAELSYMDTSLVGSPLKVTYVDASNIPYCVRDEGGLEYWVRSEFVELVEATKRPFCVGQTVLVSSIAGTWCKSGRLFNGHKVIILDINLEMLVNGQADDKNCLVMLADDETQKVWLPLNCLRKLEY